MSYRDPLAQAHEKIARLEAELAAARASRPASSDRAGIITVLVVSIGTLLAVTGGWVVIRLRGPEAAIHAYNADDHIPLGKPVRVSGEMTADPAIRGPGACSPSRSSTAAA